jgi:hypothetical protein
MHKILIAEDDRELRQLFSHVLTKHGYTVKGVSDGQEALDAMKNDYFDMAMYLLAFTGVMMGFSKKGKVKLIGSLCCGLGLIFVGLNIMSGAFKGESILKELFVNIFTSIQFPPLLILVGIIFTALMQKLFRLTLIFRSFPKIIWDLTEARSLQIPTLPRERHFHLQISSASSHRTPTV